MLTRLFSKKGLIVLGLLCILIVFAVWIHICILFSAPDAFSGARSLEIMQGMSVKDIALEAQKQGIVRSNLLLYSVLTYSHDPTPIFAGTYDFAEPTNVFGVAQKLLDQDIKNELMRVTIPEGVPVIDIATIAAKALPEFNSDEYLVATRDLEGTLFPETYFVPETFTAQDFINLQRDTYEENVAPLREAIKASGFTEGEVITLASIIEREANDEKSMKMVSGIFQNRLGIGMALQADATIEYALDTPLGELPEGQLASELRETKSPYNTYLNTGLPPTPIGNPGLIAIKAVLEPTPSDNFYYITGNDGVFHYAETLQEHNTNIAKYLR